MWYAASIFILVVIILVQSWEGVKTNFSSWQLKQKHDLASKGSKTAPVAKLDLDRIAIKPSLLSLQFGLLIALYLILFNCLNQVLLPIESFLISIGCLFLSNLIAKNRYLKLRSGRFYQRFEPKLIIWLTKLKLVGKYVNFNSLVDQQTTSLDRVESINELIFLIDNSPLVIDDGQKSLIEAGLKFTDKTVKHVMTPLDEVMTLDADDLLGPLRIDELHKTGEEFFPVLSQQNRILGIVSLGELVTLGDKQTKKARDLISSVLVETKIDEPLENVLDRLVSERTFLAIVVKNGHPIGVVSLKKILGELTGRRVW